MITIKNNFLDISTLDEKYYENSIEKLILDEMDKSNEQYKYNTLEEFEFEVQLRREIVNTAVLLDGSGMDFEVFEKSRCNNEYWDRTSNGGFNLKDNVKPSDAINDIFINGNMYATECATALTIVYYKSILNVFQEELFNKTFKTIYLMDWDIRDPLLKDVAISKEVSQILIGDRQYFSNPEHNPDTPEWQGENVIVLYNSKYYGHGIGIASSEQIIKDLNSNRKEGATQSAYLNNVAGRPNFKKLSNVYYNRGIEEENSRTIVWKDFPM